MIHQIQYVFKVPPTAALLDKARRDYIQGRKTPGVSVRPIAWQGGSTRLAAQRGHRGPAGIVKLYGSAELTLSDHDEKQPPALQLIWRIARMIGVRPQSIRYDRTKRGWHLIIEWSRRFRPVETIAIQCVLGSDRRREAYNLARVMGGRSRNKRWNLLFGEKL